ncbi:MAG: hypothetical protein N2648_03575 [Aquificaceae bacterium]|nr:hypothetical protein [Aquificaceae bacterium]
MLKLLSLLFLVATGLISSCGGGAGDSIRSTLFGEGVRLRSMQTCTVTVNSLGDLQQALMQAQNNGQDDVICVQAGTYQVTQTLTYETPNGDNGKKLTIRAVGGQVVLDGGYSVRIMHINTDSDNNGGDAGADVTIEGIGFQGGRTEYNYGGGLYVRTRQANITLINNTFSSNIAYFWGESFSQGGGAYLSSGSGNITLTNNTFSDNNAIWGGGAYLESDSGSISALSNKVCRII